MMESICQRCFVDTCQTRCDNNVVTGCSSFEDLPSVAAALAMKRENARLRAFVNEVLWEAEVQEAHAYLMDRRKRYARCLNAIGIAKDDEWKRAYRVFENTARAQIELCELFPVRLFADFVFLARSGGESGA